MSQLELSLATQTLGPHDRAAVADVAYEANTGMFGGWTAALLLKAVLDNPDSQGSASALTVNFVRRVTPGESLIIRLTALGASRSLAHWRADLHRSAGEDLLATASVVLAQRRVSETAMDFSMPSAASPDELPLSNPPGAFGIRTETRAVYGLPPFNRPNLRSISWVRENSGRHVDAVQLAYLSDVYAPRVFHISNVPRPSSTISLSLYFFAGGQEMSEIGDDYVLTDVEGTRIEQSLVGSRSRLWSRQGSLLATTEQLCWFN